MGDIFQNEDTGTERVKQMLEEKIIQQSVWFDWVKQLLQESDMKIDNVYHLFVLVTNKQSVKYNIITCDDKTKKLV